MTTAPDALPPRPTRPDPRSPDCIPVPAAAWWIESGRQCHWRHGRGRGCCGAPAVASSRRVHRGRPVYTTRVSYCAEHLARLGLWVDQGKVYEWGDVPEADDTWGVKKWVRCIDGRSPHCEGMFPIQVAHERDEPRYHRCVSCAVRYISREIRAGRQPEIVVREAPCET